jgi:thiol-disulfide isomerase/thioredoxin
MFAVLFTLAAGYLRAAAPAPNATAAAWPHAVCNMAESPADIDNIADMEDMPVHDFVKAMKLVNLKKNPKLEKLQAAQGKLEAAATAYKAAEAELQVALEDMLETPLVNQAQLAEKVGQKDLLVVFYAPWCGHCQRFVLHDGTGNPDNAPLEKINKELSGDDLEILRFDVTASEAPVDMPVQYIPTVYLQTKAGVVHMFSGDPAAPDALKDFYDANK